MTDLSNRRRFLALSGAGVAATLAGCSELGALNQGDDGGGGDTEGAVTILVQPDREELASLQEEIQADLEDEEINQTEAQEQFSSGQEALLEDAVTDFEERAEGNDDVSIRDSEADYGIFRVDAPAETLVDGIRNGELFGIFQDEYYDQYIQQQRQREQRQAMMEQQAAGGDETNESDGGGETNESAE